MRHTLRYFLARILPLALPACMVDAPVVEGSDARLGEGLGPWCQATCDRLVTCGAPNDPATCPDDCIDYFQVTFIDKNDVCSESALRAMDCLDTLPCWDPSARDACQIEAEADRCAVSQGGVVCRSVDLGEGGRGGTAGSAGYAGAAGVDCELGISNCSDGSSYRVICGGSNAECRCLVDDTVGASFSMEPLECPGAQDAIANCGWPITTLRDDGPATVGSLCSTYRSANAGNGSNQCSVSFDACESGHTYALDCADALGGARCACLIDGISPATYSAENVCLQVSADADSGISAIYQICGFEIATW